MTRMPALLAALAFAASASAQMYKWVEKDGRVRYGDTPPPGAKATMLSPPAAAPKKDPAVKDAPPAREAAPRKRQTDKAVQAGGARAGGETAARRHNCEAARAKLRETQGGRSMFTTGAAGERVLLNDEQRTEQQRRALQSVNDFCR